MCNNYVLNLVGRQTACHLHTEDRDELDQDVAQVDGLTVIVDDIVGSTGLELKVDPGVPYVYAGFAGQPPTTSCACPVLPAHMVARVLIMIRSLRAL